MERIWFKDHAGGRGETGKGMRVGEKREKRGFGHRSSAAGSIICSTEDRIVCRKHYGDPTWGFLTAANAFRQAGNPPGRQHFRPNSLPEGTRRRRNPAARARSRLRRSRRLLQTHTPRT